MTTDADVDVSWEDQRCINAFSRLNARLAELEEHVEAKAKEEEYLLDALNDLELEDDDALVPYRVGDIFLKLSVERAKERLLQDTQRVTAETKKLREEVASIGVDMTGLKKQLYAKFGAAINLEKTW